MSAILAGAAFLSHRHAWTSLAPVAASFGAASAGFVALMNRRRSPAAIALGARHKRLLLLASILAALTAGVLVVALRR